jgi:hypothetical protein
MKYSLIEVKFEETTRIGDKWATVVKHKFLHAVVVLGIV